MWVIPEDKFYNEFVHANSACTENANMNEIQHLIQTS